MKFFLSIFITVIFLPAVFAQTPAPATVPARPAHSTERKPVIIPKIDTAPVIDGKPDDEIWKQAAVFKDFRRVFADDNIVPSKPTEAYVAYDEKNLYVAFKCWDERDKIR